MAAAMRTMVCWTGGKDCNLALVRASEDPRYEVVSLVVFHPKDPVFEAHPIPVSAAQAEAVGLPIRYVEVGAEPSYKESYIQGMRRLAEEDSIDAVVTGDIDYVGTMTRNWIEECAEEAGLQCWLPLWQENRDALVGEMLDRGFELVFSCVKAPWFEAKDVGRQLDRGVLRELQAAAAASGLDVSGERGEYHTMCLDGPLYRKRVELRQREAKELKGRAGQGDQRWWVLVAVPELVEKSQTDGTEQLLGVG